MKQQSIDPKGFFNMAIRFEGGLVIVALAIAWFVGINPLNRLAFDISAVLWGIAGTLPLFLLLFLFYRYPIGSFYHIKRLLIEVLGPCFNVCKWYELLLLALLAGVSEELLFRGVLQVWFEGLWGLVAAVIVSNILFGLAHAVTASYALLAGLIGVYLAALFDIGDQRNLLVPIVTHGVYDFLAFVVVLRSYREENQI